VLVAAPPGAGGESACVGGVAASGGGTDAGPVTEDSADADCLVVLPALPAGTASGAVVAGPAVSAAPRCGRRGFPPKTVTVTATVITSIATPATAAAVRTGPERYPALPG
jgi:hypothetical protein